MGTEYSDFITTNIIFIGAIQISEFTWSKPKIHFGKWEDPVLVEEGKGIIDTCPFWDEDGNAYIVHGWAGSRAGVKSLLTIKKMNAEGTKVLDKGKHIFDGHENHPTVEGPKIYKRNGYYYIFAPAGGVATGWQLVLRSKNIYGPYDEKIVLEQGKSNCQWTSSRCLGGYKKWRRLVLSFSRCGHLRTNCSSSTNEVDQRLAVYWCRSR